MSQSHVRSNFKIEMEKINDRLLSTFPAAILTLPNRELAIIGTFDLPKTKQTGAFKVDVSVYLDRKNKPSEKSGVIATGDMNIEKNSGSVNGELKFIYPSQPKVCRAYFCII
jgi:hypothetical protein